MRHIITVGVSLISIILISIILNLLSLTVSDIFTTFALTGASIVIGSVSAESYMQKKESKNDSN